MTLRSPLFRCACRFAVPMLICLVLAYRSAHPSLMPVPYLLRGSLPDAGAPNDRTLAGSPPAYRTSPLLVPAPTV